LKRGCAGAIIGWFSISCKPALPRRAHTCVWQGKSKARKKWQIKDKESMKWLNSFSRVAAIQVEHPETRLVSLGDREPDIHNLFSTRRGPRYRIP
jgi:hypothetical protein